MTPRIPAWRRMALGATRAGTVLSASMLFFGLVGLVLGSPDSASASASNGGTLSFVYPTGSEKVGQAMTEGGSAEAFTLKLPAKAACTGDSASAGYRIHSYMVPDSVEPTTLTFNSKGPTPGGLGADFRQPLFTTGSSRYASILTAIAETANGPGQIVGVPNFDFKVFVAGNVPEGKYNLGVMCVDATGALDKYWNLVLEVTTDTADSPAQFTWKVAPIETPSTTTTTTSTTTSTTVAGGGGSTTTSTTTTTVTGTTAPDSTTTAATTPGFDLGSGGGFTGGTGGETTATTGANTSRNLLWLWGLVFVVCGRIAVLLGRKPQVATRRR